jgi:hypothetical protein
VEADPQVLLVLVALRLASKRPVATTTEPLKSLKKPLQLAKDQGLIVESEVPALDKKGKPTKKMARVVDLTDKGSALLLANAGPEVQAAMASRQQAAVREQLESDRAALRQEVIAAIAAKSKAKTGDPAKAVADLAKTVQQMAERLEKLESALRSGTDDPLVARIDQAFARFEQKLGGSQPVSEQSVATDAAWGDEVVRLAAEQKQRNPFQRLTLPQLFEKLHAKYSNLTLGQFHDGIRRMHDQRRIRLGPYTQALATLDDPRNALFLDREVKYYVELP